MKVLISGGDSQLGCELMLTAPATVDAVALDIDPLDITSPEAVSACFAQVKPQVLINTAAYTAVDRAEEQEALAHAVNADGAFNLAQCAKRSGCRLIQVSTDFVFSGKQSVPYLPADRPEPLSVYGASKLAGERRVLDAAGDLATVVRTSWLYSRFGQNFALTMLRLFNEKSELSIVDDQIGTPTWARGLAGCLWEVASRPDIQGVLHWSDLGVASWYDFSVAVYEEAQNLGLLGHAVRIAPIPASAYPTPAARPSYSVLNKHATFSRLESRPLHWRQAVRQMLTDHQEHRRA